ncbi:putative F-box/LRR-repeat protein At3g58880 [Bidens hawaiensis]|uniref:putative F-box/LRR-repeat protein At3g58880 n=1 Tax=Bidens hawaiensis TaxID=980011 RepID=UPI004049D56E
MDRISELPDFIAHHILSFLNSPTELVRMSVLSKTWLHLTASFPVLYFSDDDFTSRDTFFKYVDYATTRFYLQNVTLYRLKLVATLEEHAELDIVNRCLELVLNNGLYELVIDISITNSSSNYRLPNTLLSVSVLESLTIRGCELPSSLMLDAVKFKSLIELKLESVSIDDEAIKHLTTSCPRLEEFHIVSCDGFKNVCVYGLRNLQVVWIDYDTVVERIDIDAPNLLFLFITDIYGIGAPQMNLASCKKLVVVPYFGLPSPNSNGFTNFSSSLPIIESFFLDTKSKFDSLRLSSAPSLISFGYPLVMYYQWPLLRLSTHLNVCMQCYLDGDINTLWFYMLRLFLYQKNGFEVLNLYIQATYRQKFIDLEKLKTVTLPPYELEHVELQLDTHKELLDYVAFLEAVLWCCRPRSLILRSTSPLSDFKELSDLVKITYEKLLKQEDQGHTSIQIVKPSSSLLMSLSGEGRAMSFIKEEVVQEEAG